MYFKCIFPTVSFFVPWCIMYVLLNNLELTQYTLHFKECSIQIFAVKQIFIRVKGVFNIYNEKVILVHMLYFLCYVLHRKGLVYYTSL